MAGCEMDGTVEDHWGRERYWHCEESQEAWCIECHEGFCLEHIVEHTESECRTL